jgi:hypothetical protein
MKRKNTLLGILILFVFTVNAQQNSIFFINVNSLSGENIRVKIEIDAVNDILSLSLNPNEVFNLNGCRDLAGKIKVLGNKFILINYQIRGGTGVKLQKSAIFCVDNQKIIQSLDVLSYESYNPPKFKNKHSITLGVSEDNYSYSLLFKDLVQSGTTLYINAIEKMNSEKLPRLTKKVMKIYFDKTDKKFQFKN